MHELTPTEKNTSEINYRQIRTLRAGLTPRVRTDSVLSFNARNPVNN
jgi:hypothetical protein